MNETGKIVAEDKEFPRIICLCGSTKFKQEFIDANFFLTMKGNIILTVGWFGHADGEVYTPTEKEKKALDQLHMRKIDLADKVLVINVGGYIGESTRNEINYAKSHGKPIEYLEALKEGRIPDEVNRSKDDTR